MIVLGLNGRLHSGKDTAFEYIDALAQENGLFADRRGFADKLKLSAARALGFDPADYDEALAICNRIKETGVVVTYADGNELCDIDGRQYLQYYGTEAHRDVFGADFWVDALLPKPTEHGLGQRVAAGQGFPGVDILVITDCRFESEARRVLDLGGEVWHIEADQRLGPLPENAHVSEHPLREEFITRTVRNDGTIAEFGTALSFAFHEMISR